MLTNSFTTFEEPLSASLWTLEESLFEDFDLEDVLGADMVNEDVLLALRVCGAGIAQ
jgi:hypothetical protein